MSYTRRMLGRENRRRMVDRCTITRSGSGDPVWDGERYVNPEDAVFTGACLLQPMDSAIRVVQAGDRPVSLGTYRLMIPDDVEVRLGDTVTMTKSTDDQAVGVELRVVDVPKGDQFAVRIVVVEEAS